MTRKLRWLVPFLALAATMVAGTASAAAAPTVQAGRCSHHTVDRSSHDQGAAGQQDRSAPHHGTYVDVKWTPQGPSVGYGFPIPQRPSRRGHTGRSHQPHRRPQVRQPRQRQEPVADEVPDRDRRASASDRHRQRRPEGTSVDPAPRPVQGDGLKAAAPRPGRQRRRLPQLDRRRRTQPCPGRVVLRPRHQAGHGIRQRARRQLSQPRRVSADCHTPQTPARRSGSYLIPMGGLGRPSYSKDSNLVGLRSDHVPGTPASHGGRGRALSEG